MSDFTLSFLDSESAAAASAGGESRSQVNPHGIVDALARAANEDTAIVLVIGWHEQAAVLLATDAVLARKAVVWAMRTGDLAAAAALFSALPDLASRVKVAIVEDDPDLLRTISVMPKAAWTLACLVDDAELKARIQMLRTNELVGYYAMPDRRLRDLSHLVRRGSRLAQGIRADWWSRRFAGCAALCVAAGPSLAHHLDRVRSLAKHCLVIAADVVHARLHQAGVPVDMVVHVDSDDEAMVRVRAPPHPDCVLVLPMDGHADSDTAWRHVTYFGEGGLATLFLGEGNHLFPTGTNVGASAVGWAYHLGCSDIILAGHDLAMDGDAYYNDLVDNRAPIESLARRIVEVENVQIMGNSGALLRTTIPFRNGVRDLEVLCMRCARVGATVYNLNAGTTYGARIDGAQALPADWQPAQPKPAIEVSAAVRIGDRGGVQADVAGRCWAAIQAYAEAWDRHPQAASNPLAPFMDLSVDRELVLGHQLLASFQMAQVLQAFRAACLPLSSGRTEALRATARALSTVRTAALPLLKNVLDSGAYPDTAASRWMRVPPVTPFMGHLQRMIPGLLRGSLDEALMPVISRDIRALSRLLPGVAVHSAVQIGDLVRFVAMSGDWASPAMLGDLFAALRLPIASHFRSVVELAEKTDFVLPSDDRPDSWAGSQGWAAVRALERLQHGVAPVDQADVAVACAWQHTRQPAVAWLVEQRRLDDLRAMVQAGHLDADDALGDHLLSRLDSVEQAMGLLETEAGTNLGEASICATAERLLADGLPKGAAQLASSIRPLSANAERAWKTLFLAWLRLGDWPAIESFLSGLPAHALRIRAMYALLSSRMPPADALAELSGYPELRPVPLLILSQVIAESGERWAADPTFAETLIALIDESLAAGPPQDEVTALGEVRELLARRGQATG